ncbi:MAG: hypothetical protein V2A73_09780 [Pseudomonadota bacterium]
MEATVSKYGSVAVGKGVTGEPGPLADGGELGEPGEPGDTDRVVVAADSVDAVGDLLEPGAPAGSAEHASRLQLDAEAAHQRRRVFERRRPGKDRMRWWQASTARL